MKKLFKSFARTEGGAMTIEFLVLIAAVVGLGIAGVNGLDTGTQKDVDVNDTLERFTSGN